MTNKIGLVKYSLVRLIYFKILSKISFHSYHTRIFKEKLGKKIKSIAFIDGSRFSPQEGHSYLYAVDTIHTHYVYHNLEGLHFFLCLDK